MIYQPDYILNVDGQEIKFLFVSFTFKRFCERKRIELEDLFRILGKAFGQGEGYENVKDLKTVDIEDVLLAGHEAWCVYNKVAFNVDVPTVDRWVDSLGGWVKGSAECKKIMLLFTAKLLNIDPGILVIEKEAEQAEKNVVPPVLNGSPGENSTSEQPQRA